MWRTMLGISAIALVAFLLVQLLVTSDRDRVEKSVGRLCDLAAQGGPDAAAQILSALAEDYSGDVPRSEIERYVRRYVSSKRLASVKTGGVDALWHEPRFTIPILTVRATTKSGVVLTCLLSVSFEKRDGEWKIVDVSRARFGSGLPRRSRPGSAAPRRKAAACARPSSRLPGA